MHLETFCEAVGLYRTGGTTFELAEQWNGTTWEVQSPPNPTGNASLMGVSCTAKSSCMAVGTYGTAKEFTLSEYWNGTSWEVKLPPNPTGGTFSVLWGVSCIEACHAVGSYFHSGKQVTLGEYWSGTTWEIKTTPNPVGATESELGGVSCKPIKDCVAVGFYETGTERLTLGEEWAGTSWKLLSTPNTASTDNLLAGVSCTSATSFCEAVGYYPSTLAEEWNGSSWTLQTTPVPSGATWAGLSGVSCVSTTLCMAVGSYKNSSSEELTLVNEYT